MALPKKGTRKLTYHDEEYRWAVGKSRLVKSKDGMEFLTADLIVETPNGRLLKEEWVLRIIGHEGDFSVTTSDAIRLIEANL